MPTIFAPWSAKRSAAGSMPRCLMRKNWSSAPPSSASARFSSTDTTFAAGSTCTSEIFDMSILFTAAIAWNSWPSGSPGLTARRLPSRSFGERMPALASEITAKPVELSSDITDFTSAPFEAVRITLEESARPKVSEPAATTCTVLAEPRPSLIVRSMPSAE